MVSAIEPMTPARLRVARERLGLSHYALDRALGLTDGLSSRWERGTRAIGNPVLLALAVEALLGRQGAPDTERRG